MATVIDDLYITVTRIMILSVADNNEKILGYASGFLFLNKKQELFLITNRHVVLDEKKNHFPTMVRIQLHTDAHDLKQNSNFDVKLYKGTTRIWQEINPSIDVVAIPLPVKELQSKGFIFKAFNSQNFLPSNIKLRVGEDVLIIGYPLGIYYDAVHNLPTVRNGIIASAYPVPYRGNPYFLVDARLHEGTSGSPVIVKPQSSWQDVNGNTLMTGFQTFLIGINSATWSLPKDIEPLGLNVTFFASLVEQLTP